MGGSGQDTRWPMISLRKTHKLLSMVREAAASTYRSRFRSRSTAAEMCVISGTPTFTLQPMDREECGKRNDVQVSRVQSSGC